MSWCRPYYPWAIVGYSLVMTMVMMLKLIAERANPAGRMETVNANPKGTLSWQQSSKKGKWENLNFSLGRYFF